MKKQFSTSWKSSVQPRKQRKYRIKAPLHLRNKMMSVHISKELKTKYGKRNVPVRKGDKVKVLRGQYKGRTGEVERINLKKYKVYVQGVENIRKDGGKVQYPISPSNLMIIELKMDDKKRKASVERK
ncbi:50S ribosomal protein L24 [Candidatus Woesearchaeota archaeon]|nr:50S ribosomal protein L24 [Candidatus Woesearchaeota archaeon]